MPKIAQTGEDQWSFNCPGCNDVHSINGGWSFDQNFEQPTLTPSVLVRTGHFVDGDRTSCWCSFDAEQIANGEPVSGFACSICHSFVRKGMIQFLGDCTHEMAGQTVEIPEWEI